MPVVLPDRPNKMGMGGTKEVAQQTTFGDNIHMHRADVFQSLVPLGPDGFARIFLACDGSSSS